ncbi:MAG: S41 family peptidase [Alloprevotella sp.]|nr:S41 family peptidase [Alloprevotella sp.]
MRQLLTLLALAVAAIPGAAQSDESAHNFEVAKNLEIFSNLYKELDLYYVDTLNAEKNISNALLYMLGQLDPYTEYYTEKDADGLRQLTTGKYAGIGSLIAVRQSERRCIVAEPYEGMPAAEAGLLPGDIILAQDGRDYGLAEKGQEAEYSSRVSASLRGEPGTTFTLTVRRYGRPEPFDVRLTRRTITLPSVVFSTVLHDSIGYIMLDSYKEQTTRDVRIALAALKQQGARRLVLDLRGNPGGLLEQAVGVTNLFLPKGRDIVSLKGKRGEDGSTYRTQDEPMLPDMPLAVLVDGGTASSAEITSGALQDYDRAVIVGTRTYGKGLVQQTRQLPYNTTLKLTTAKYYIPSGRCIQAYSYRNGLPQHLPDSLAREFRTAGGRTVRDCGGIQPDVTARPDSLPALLSYLEASDALADYVADYHNRHASIPPAAQFRLTDEEYSAFKAFLKQARFTYDNRSKAALDILREIARFEGYADVTSEELEALEAKLVHNLDYDLDHWAADIRRQVEAHIVNTYYYQRGEAEHALRGDKTLHEAVRILADDAEYRRILSPQP